MNATKTKEIFEQCVTAGLYTEFITPARRSPQWQVVDLAGRIRGVGEDEESAIDAAWSRFIQDDSRQG